MTTGAIRCEK